MDHLPKAIRVVLKVLAGLAGAVLLVLGILGLFLPFLQGILMIMLGLSLLALVWEPAARWRRWLKRRFVGDRQASEAE